MTFFLFLRIHREMTRSKEKKCEGKEAHLDTCYCIGSSIDTSGRFFHLLDITWISTLKAWYARLIVQYTCTIRSSFALGAEEWSPTEVSWLEEWLDNYCPYGNLILRYSWGVFGLINTIKTSSFLQTIVSLFLLQVHAIVLSCTFMDRCCLSSTCHVARLDFDKGSFESSSGTQRKCANSW